VSPFTKNCSQGAATSVLAALHEPASDIAGQYLVDCRPGKAAPAVEDEAMASRLWAMSEDWVAAGASTT